MSSPLSHLAADYERQREKRRRPDAAATTALLGQDAFVIPGLAEDYQRRRDIGPDRLHEQAELESDPTGFLEGFGRTFLYESGLWPVGGGLIGLDEPPEVEAFRRESPIAAFGALVAGAAIPYGFAAGTGLKVASRLPILKRAVDFTQDAERIRDAPALTRAAEEIVRFTPFEIARTGAAAAFGPTGAYEEVRNQALFELGAFGALGGAIGKLRGRVKPRRSLSGEGRLYDRFPEYELTANPQTKLENIRTILSRNSEKELGEDLLGEIYQARRALREEVAAQRPPRNRAFVKRLVEGVSASSVNKIFRGERTGIARSRVSPEPVKQGGLGSWEAVDEVIGKLKSPEAKAQFWEAVQYPTLLRADTAEASKSLRTFLKDKMLAVDSGIGNNAWIRKEAEGIWVMAQRIKGRTLEGRPGDEFLLFKTNDPGLFHPAAAAQGKTLARHAFLFDPLADLSELAAKSPHAKFILELQKLLREGDVRGVEANKITEIIESFMGPELKALSREAVEGARFVKQHLKQVLSPALHEFSESPIAVTLMNIVRAAYARANSRSTALFFGKRENQQARSIYAEIFGTPSRSGGLEPIINQMTKKELGELYEASIRGMSVAEARAAGFGRNTVQLMRALDKIWKGYGAETQAIKDITGGSWATPSSTTYQLAMSLMGAHRSGDYRVLLQRVDADGALGQVVGVASGRGARQALDEAKEIVRLAKDQGVKIGYRESTNRLYGHDESLDLLGRIAQLSGTPEADAIQAARLQLLRQDPTKAFTHNELRRIVYGNLIESERLIADKLLHHMLAYDVHKLKQSHPLLHKQFQQRLNAFAGRRGEVVRAVDEAADLVLRPIIGQGASEIVRMTNRAMFDLTLGFMDVGFGVMNALTPIQTLLPDIAWQMSASPHRLDTYLSYALVLGREPATVGFFEPIKVMGRALKLMRNPTDEFREAFSRAVDRGAIDPKFVEEFFGETSEVVKNWGKVLKGEEGFLEWFKAFSEFIPAKTEQLSRAVSFASSYLVGKDVFRLEGEKLLQYAVESTARANFLYSTADRPRIITGSVGSLFGLFKNWPMHYTANLMSYAGEGILRGNFKPLAWSALGTFGLGGVGALPLYGAANAASKFLSDDSLVVNAYENFANEGEDSYALDTFFYGLPALGGVTLQSRVAPTGNELVRDLTFLTSSATIDRGVALYDGLGGFISRWRATGKSPITSQHIRDQFARALLPRTVYRSLQFTEDNAIRSLRSGNKIYSGATFPERAAFILGITPVDIEQSYELTTDLFKDQQKRARLTSEFGRALAEAEMRRDYDELRDLWKRVVLSGADPGGVQASSRIHIRNAMEPILERQFEDRAYQLQKTLGLR